MKSLTSQIVTFLLLIFISSFLCGDSYGYETRKEAKRAPVNDQAEEDHFIGYPVPPESDLTRRAKGPKQIQSNASRQEARGALKHLLFRKNYSQQEAEVILGIDPGQPNPKSPSRSNSSFKTKNRSKR
jgi:hypothetical protein